MSNPYTNFAKVSFGEVLTKAINSAAESNPNLKRCLVELDGKKLGIEVVDLRFTVCLRVSDNIVFFDDSFEQEQLDLLFRGTISEFLKVMASRDMAPQVLDPIEIVGDIRLAQRLYKILKNIDFDWEEEVAKRVGDVPARQIGNLVRWCSQKIFAEKSPFKKKVRNHLVDEVYILPESSRVEHFLDEVDTLQEDIDRLEKRVDRLSKG